MCRSLFLGSHVKGSHAHLTCPVFYHLFLCLPVRVDTCVFVLCYVFGVQMAWNPVYTQPVHVDKALLCGALGRGPGQC